MTDISNKTIEEKLFNARFELLGATIRRAEAEEELEEAWNFFIVCGDFLEDTQIDIDNARDTMRALRTEQKNIGSGERNE